MPRSPFDFERGITQWRTSPLNGPPLHGESVFTLGYDGLVDHYNRFNVGDYIETTQTIDVTNVMLVRCHVFIVQPMSMPDRENVSDAFQLIAGDVTTGGHRVVIARGVSEADIGRELVVTGCINAGNNTTFEIAGIKDSLTAYVNKTVVTEGPRTAITATLKGYRWKFSALIDVSGTPTERGRIIQEPTEAGFYRNDLVMNVSKMTGDHDITFRMTLVEHNPTNIYTLT